MSTRVALVEDNDDLRSSIKRLLQRSPQLRVVADYPDAESALADLVQHKPDVVLMDITMPGMNGLTVTEVLRKEAPQIKVLILSMQASPEYVLRCAQAGFGLGKVPEALLHWREHPQRFTGRDHVRTSQRACFPSLLTGEAVSRMGV